MRRNFIFPYFLGPRRDPHTVIPFFFSKKVRDSVSIERGFPQKRIGKYKSLRGPKEDIYSGSHEDDFVKKRELLFPHNNDVIKQRCFLKIRLFLRLICGERKGEPVRIFKKNRRALNMAELVSQVAAAVRD